ncbi:MAG: hypothetical protein BWZ09_02637 [Alphaproteobacteria bacterium ADurb.BinA305]|nr:MAG: hypothetical protein BWZ09_02637 [Alphaproteobacteria bacterium ADurb.BinA305]
MHVLLLGGGQPGDDVALARALRVACSGEHDAEREAAVPLGLGLVELAGDGGFDQIGEIGLQTHHDRLRLGIAHATVELDHARLALAVDHQPGVKESGVGQALGGHAGQRRVDDLAHHARMHVGGDHRGGRVGAHAAGVGALVAVEQALVVLAGGERERVLAVGHDDEAGLLALHELLDDDARTRIAHAVVEQHHVDRGVRLVGRHRHHHALARGQAIGLDHDRRTLGVDVGVCGGGIREGLVLRGRDVVADEELLGEVLRALELGGGLGRTEDRQAGGAEGIDHASRQRRLGADHGEGDVLVLGELDQHLDVGDGNVLQQLFGSGAGVARRHQHAGDLGRLGKFPGQRVFAAAGTDDEDFHVLLRSSAGVVVLSDGSDGSR